MKQNKIIISALVSLMAAGVMAQTSDKKLHEMNLDTDFELFEGKSFYTADIDSIVFYKGMWFDGIPGEIYNMMTICGNGILPRKAHIAVPEINGIRFVTRDSRKLYAPKFDYYEIDSLSRGNSVIVRWEPVDGASGYEIKYCKRTWQAYTHGTVDFWGNGEFEQWISGQHPENTTPLELPADAGTLTIPADKAEVTISGLQYGAPYCVAVRALSAEGEEFHSDWSIRHSMMRWYNYLINTEARYIVPKILSCVSREENSVRLGFDLSYAAHKDEEGYENHFQDYFEIVDGSFVADELWVTNDMAGGAPVDEKWSHYKLTAEDIANGYVDVTGLQEGTPYTFTLVNTNISSLPDAKYNTITLRTKGNPETVVVHHSADPSTGEYAACNLTPYIVNDVEMRQPRSKVLYLEGDKAYYISGHIALRNGFTLETLPEDVAAGKRAKVYLGGISYRDGALVYCYFMIGGTVGKEDLLMDPITFRNIDFDCPEAGNYGSGNAQGNYFINMYSNHEPFVLEALNIEGCTFQRMIRGLVRIQGITASKIKSINCDGNLFYNCGYYDNNGRGYAWFAGNGMINSNIYTDFRFVNNTIYDSPRTCLVTDNSKDLPWKADDKWNIVIENNTFINFSTRTNGRNIIDFRFVPGGSYFSVQRNLFSLARCSADDQRSLNQGGADIRTINGSGEISFEVKDNYSTGCLDEHFKNDGIFNLGGAFSARKNSFGAFEFGNMGTEEDLVVKVGSTPLRTDELFVNPNPPYNQVQGDVNPNDHKAPDNIMEALRYKQTPEVLNHEIYTKNIGDPRWRN